MCENLSVGTIHDQLLVGSAAGNLLEVQPAVDGRRAGAPSLCWGSGVDLPTHNSLYSSLLHLALYKIIWLV